MHFPFSSQVYHGLVSRFYEYGRNCTEGLKALASWSRLVSGVSVVVQKSDSERRDINGPADCYALASSKTQTAHGTSV